MWLDNFVYKLSTGEIVAVYKDRTRQRKAEEQIKSSLEEKEVLLKEIHHRVKNNMQIIQSLLNLQINEIKEEKIRQPLIDSNNRIKSMSLIHETLYKSPNIGKLNAKSYFNEIVQYLGKLYFRSDRTITFDLKVASLTMDMDQNISCGLIINELVSNALKHAFNAKPKGNISIALERPHENKAVLIIKDDGCGFKTEKKIENFNSFGMKIVRIVTKGQLKGNIKINNDEGAVIEINFPLT